MLDDTTIMLRSVLAVALVAGSASVASAGTFVGLGIGTNMAISTDSNITDGTSRTGRLEVGYKLGRLSVEGIGGRGEMGGPFTQAPTITSLGVAGKYSIPLGDNFEAFGRLGYQHMMLDADTSSLNGNGLFGGGGFEYRINALVTGASLYVDYTIEHANIENPDYPGRTYGVTTRFWTLGATLSL